MRYLVLTKLDPFSAAAMDQVNAISDAARSAQPNTYLADATISMGGYPAALRDTRDYYQKDIRFIIAITMMVVLLTLMLLLRAIIAPLYLVGSVVLSYFAALGIGVLVFQYLLHQQLHWTVPPLAFVVLVAVGADYNLLFASRLRDESGGQHAIRRHPDAVVDRRCDHRGRLDFFRGVDVGGAAVLQHRYRGPGRVRHRCRNPAGHLPGTDGDRARHGYAGRKGELVAVEIELAGGER